MSANTALVPPRRLGTLLRQARLASGLELVDLIGDSGLSLVELDDVEHGRRDLDERTMKALVASYGIQDSGLIPERSQLIIDLDQGRIAVNHSDLAVDAASGPDAVLARYLALVYRLRDKPLGTPLPLRDVDVEVLASALEIGNGDIETRLHRLMDQESAIERDQRRIRRQLLLPLAGVLVAATGLGTLVLVAQPETSVNAPATVTSIDASASRISTAAIEEAPVLQTNIGNGGAIEVNGAN